MVERSLPTPEVHGSNSVIDKTLYRTFTVNYIEKTKKRSGMTHFWKMLRSIFLQVKNVFGGKFNNGSKWTSLSLPKLTKKMFYFEFRKQQQRRRRQFTNDISSGKNADLKESGTRREIFLNNKIVEAVFCSEHKLHSTKLRFTKMFPKARLL